jgi:hypothetical protein
MSSKVERACSFVFGKINLNLAPLPSPGRNSCVALEQLCS